MKTKVPEPTPRQSIEDRDLNQDEQRKPTNAHRNDDIDRNDDVEDDDNAAPETEEQKSSEEEEDSENGSANEDEDVKGARRMR